MKFPWNDNEGILNFQEVFLERAALKHKHLPGVVSNWRRAKLQSFYKSQLQSFYKCCQIIWEHLESRALTAAKNTFFKEHLPLTTQTIFYIKRHFKKTKITNKRKDRKNRESLQNLQHDVLLRIKQKLNKPFIKQYKHMNGLRKWFQCLLHQNCQSLKTIKSIQNESKDCY